jgi:hypothetical protein
MENFRVTAKPMEMTQSFEINFDKILQVYRGKLDCCRCGCEGDYLYTSIEAEKLNADRENHFIKSSDKAIMNDIKKFVSGDYEVQFMHNDTHNELILEIHTHTERSEEDERMGVTIYMEKKCRALWV